MALRTCGECPCGKKVAGGPLGMFTEIWCEKCKLKGNLPRKHVAGQRSKKEKADLAVVSNFSVLGTFITSAQHLV